MLSVPKWPAYFLPASEEEGRAKDPASPGALAVLSSPLATSGLEGGDLHGTKWLPDACTPLSTGSKGLRGEQHTGGDLRIQPIS